MSTVKSMIPACFALIMSLLVSGCATTQYGEQITTVNYYPQCYAPIGDLREADKSYNKTIVAGAGIGALTGALAGLLITGKAEGALVGAAAGGVAGAGIGYAKAKQERIADDNQRMASYLQDIDGDISGLDRGTAAARVARNCYEQEFKSAVAQFKAGKMPRDELGRRYSEINNGITEASNVLGTLISSAGKREEEYQQALTEEATMASRPVPVVAQPKALDKAPSKAPATSSSTINKAPKPTQTAVAKTARPSKDDTSLEAVAQNTQRLSESRQSAAAEQAAMRQMQEEMQGTLATVTS